MLKRWEELPDYMRIPEVRPYWEALREKRLQLILKRCFDLAAAAVLLVILLIPMAAIAALICLDSPGGAFYRQERVTACGERFRIHKFRTMVRNAEQIGTALTVADDCRITRVGKALRRVRLDELPQLLDVLAGTMTFVGTRPEAVKYVEQYRPEYYATLLLPAGVTSEASIRFKDEDRLLRAAEDAERVYIDQVLPAKMKWNLEAIRGFSLRQDFRTLIRTIAAVLGKDLQ